MNKRGVSWNSLLVCPLLAVVQLQEVLIPHLQESSKWTQEVYVYRFLFVGRECECRDEKERETGRGYNLKHFLCLLRLLPGALGSVSRLGLVTRLGSVMRLGSPSRQIALNAGHLGEVKAATALTR